MPQTPQPKQIGDQLSAIGPLGVLERVDEILELTYRSATLGNHDDPLEEAVYIMLSRQTREAAYQRVHRELRHRWRSWEALRDAPVDDVAKVIAPAGFGPSRARELHGLLHAVSVSCENRGIDPITLDWLRELSDAEAETFLVGLPGIGTKSARCVMHYSLGRHVFAVDTHVRRILDRLELVTDPGGKVKASTYDAIVPARLRQRLHVNLVHHGRAFCRSTSPRCSECPLISFCRPGQERATKVHASVAPRKRHPVAVELFAGGGGLGAGFDQAGFDVAVAIELDRAAAQTYRVNHPGTIVLEADATLVTVSELARLAPRVTGVTAIIAGPPCQGYSAAGKRKAADEKNLLYRAVIKLARELQPRFVAIENVPGMRYVEGQGFADTVVEELSEAGFDAEAHLLRACDFGVPQLRHRLLFLAQRADLGSCPRPPRPTHCPGNHCAKGCGDSPGSACGLLPTPTVLQALRGLPLLDHGQSAEHLRVDGQTLLNGSTMKHCQRVLNKISTITPGAGPISYRRLHKDMARTIVAGHRALPVHPILHRTISVREAARIQGFEDDHVFCGSRSQQPLQVANAVPPALAHAVALELLAVGPVAQTESACREQMVPRGAVVESVDTSPVTTGAMAGVGRA